MDIDFKTIIPKFDAIVARGLCKGIGERDGQMCIGAAICAALGEPHGDEPSCVSPAVRQFKFRLNDANWSSPQVRSEGLRDLGIAQIGSRGVVNDVQFTKKISEKTIRQLIPALFREVFSNNKQCLNAALLCEQEGTAKVANVAADAAKVTYAATYAAFDVANAANVAAAAADAATNATYAAANVAYAAAAAADAAAIAAKAAAVAADAANAANAADKYLKLSANLALETLRELKSPGCEWV